MINFYFSGMSGGKSEKIILDYYTLKSHGHNPLILKPTMDTRDPDKIKSRSGLSIDCMPLIQENILQYISEENGPKTIMIDEIQFSSTEMIDFLNIIDLQHEVVINCFGLKNSYKGVVFDPILRLFQYADIVQNINISKTENYHIKFNKDKNPVNFTNEDPLQEAGGDDMYLAVKRKTWYSVYYGDNLC